MLEEADGVIKRARSNRNGSTSTGQLSPTGRATTTAAGYTPSLCKAVTVQSPNLPPHARQTRAQVERVRSPHQLWPWDLGPMAEAGFTAGFPAIKPECLESSRWSITFKNDSFGGCRVAGRTAPGLHRTVPYTRPLASTAERGGCGPLEVRVFPGVPHGSRHAPRPAAAATGGTPAHRTR